jgi:hypothetical protein
MNVKRLVPLVAMVATLISATACNNQSDSSATTPTVPTAPTITEPAFTGSLSQGGTPQIFTFTVQQIGPLTITLTQAGPPPTATVGLALGTPTFSTGGTVCTPFAQSNAQVGVNAPQISGTVSSAGGYCLAVYDAGLLAAGSTITFSVTVAHT